MERELQLLKQYMNIYIQLLPVFIKRYGRNVDWYLPTFDYFKNVYDQEQYSMIIPHFKEVISVNGNVFYKAGTQGLGTEGVAYRYFNYYQGVKYYTDDMNGEYSLSNDNLKIFFLEQFS